MIKNRIWNKNTVNYRLGDTWRITGNQFAGPMVSLRKNCMAKRVQMHQSSSSKTKTKNTFANLT